MGSKGSWAKRLPLSDVSDIDSLNALADLHYGLIGLVAGAIVGLLVGLLAALAGAPADGLLLTHLQVDRIGLVDQVLDSWFDGDIENPARLMRLARRDPAKQNDAAEVAELGLLITKMRSNLTGDNLAYFEAVLAGGRASGAQDRATT
jgi:hypothetical protein